MYDHNNKKIITTTTTVIVIVAGPEQTYLQCVQHRSIGMGLYSCRTRTPFPAAPHSPAHHSPSAGETENTFPSKLALTLKYFDNV